MEKNENLEGKVDGLLEKKRRIFSLRNKLMAIEALRNKNDKSKSLERNFNDELEDSLFRIETILNYYLTEEGSYRLPAGRNTFYLKEICNSFFLMRDPLGKAKMIKPELLQKYSELYFAVVSLDKRIDIVFENKKIVYNSLNNEIIYNS